MGRGAFGVVYKAKVKTIAQIVAIKEVNGANTKVYEEVNILQNASHPNIIRFIEAFEENKKLYIVMEYADKGTLATQTMGWNEMGIWEFVRQMADGLSYLHTKNIIHRDLKPNNILCVSVINTLRLTFKISDFGIAKLVGQIHERNYTATCIGYAYSYCYMAPEVLERREYTFSADMFSLGALFSFVCNNGKHLFNSFGEILRLQGTVDPVPSGFTNNLRSIVSQLLERDYRHRPSAAEVYNKAVAMLLAFKNLTQ